jgi:hypothetical protein
MSATSSLEATLIGPSSVGHSTHYIPLIKKIIKRENKQALLVFSSHHNLEKRTVYYYATPKVLFGFINFLRNYFV